MTTDCSRLRDWIPRSLLGDLGAGEQGELERHLDECAPCRAEQDLYQATLGHLNHAPDVDPPRHFFVYEEQARPNPWLLFREMSLAWKGALAATAVVICVIATAAATGLQVRAEGGTLTLGFGTLPPRQIVVPPPALDTGALEARVLAAAEERNRRDMLQWVKTLRAEVATSNRKFTPQQQALLETALGRLQNRMEANLDDAVTAVRLNNERSVAELYQAVSTRRELDLNTIDKRIKSLAANGEMKSNQTDAILETLLQVAELNIK